MHSHFHSRACARGRLLLCFLLLAPGFTVLRAQTAVPAPPPTQLDPFLVPGRATDLVGTATSASQGIVGAAELDARPFLRRGELLEVIPGVVITQHSGDGKANQYFLRGFNLDHGTDLAIAVDGLPVNLRSHAHGQGYADLNFIIPELVRQVDFNKGPFFAEVGDFSAAGAAEFRQFDQLPRGFATLAFGENRFARLAAGGTRLAGDAALTGAIELTHDDGPWALSQDANRFNGFVRRHWTRAAGEFRLTALGYRATWRSTDQIPQRAFAAGEIGRFGHVDPTDGGESERASISFDATLKGADATTQLSAYAIHYRLNLYSNFTYFLDDPVNGDQFNQRDRRLIVGGATTRTWSAARPAGGSVTTIGAQVRGDFIDELGLHRTTRRERIGTTRDDTVDQISAGAFAKNELRWNEWLRTTLGVRADGYRFAVASDDARNSGSRSAAIVSPKLGVALGPWARTEIYANAGTGFHSNDARGTTIRVDPADGVTPVDRVTPLVRSRGAEAGVRTTAVRGLVSSIAVWALELDSELVFVGDAGGTEPAGRTRRYGVEWANFWRVASWLSLDADVALTRARYRDDAGGGRHIANSMGTVVTAGASLGRGAGWFGGARVRYFGSQPLTEDNATRAPSSISFNTRIGWRSERWEVSLDLLNALNRANNDIAYAYRSRLPGEPAEGVDDVHFHPAEPRTWRVAFKRSF
ncbi:TonB-dependent receptor [Horticoccus sp. 23ND18S-11]|uniref:TonB-dependent receptor n=1 Tax=Horticoccus sp. 23ND18S-11 TaxID=3391832 RepID=UPI0039C9C6BA